MINLANLSSEPQTQTIVVASRNPVKLDAALAGFQRMFPEQPFEVEGVSVASNVRDQPMSDQETLDGATHRAEAARTMCADADYAVGIEGGIEPVDGEMVAFAWVVIQSSEHSGKSRSGAFLLPPRVRQLVLQGRELGDANDEVFARHNSKQQGGAVGLLTNDVISRQQLYEHAVVLALAPFKRPELYP